MSRLSGYLLLILLFVAGDRFGGYLLQRQAITSQFRYARLYDGRAGAELLLLGNSRGLLFYQPFIERVSGKSTFNLSYNGLPMDAAEALVLDYLDCYPAPRKLVIDITMCDRENDALLAGLMPYATRSERLDALIRRKTPKAWWGGRLSVLYRMNNEIFQRALYYRNRPDTEWLLDRVIAPELAATAATQSYNLDVKPYLLERLQETVAAAQKKGVAVELVVAPYFPGFNVTNLDALVAEAGRLTGLPVHDYRSALGDPGLFGDFMHPNKQGAAVFVNLMQRDRVFD